MKKNKGSKKMKEKNKEKFDRLCIRSNNSN